MIMAPLDVPASWNLSQQEGAVEAERSAPVAVGKMPEAERLAPVARVEAEAEEEKYEMPELMSEAEEDIDMWVSKFLLDSDGDAEILEHKLNKEVNDKVETNTEQERVAKQGQYEHVKKLKAAMEMGTFKVRSAVGTQFVRWLDENPVEQAKWNKISRSKKMEEHQKEFKMKWCDARFQESTVELTRRE